ncbi:SLOG family protein, partial [Candidatus Phycosocius bacilliformis]|uniref:SLOG family protein n=1 Tax=Candidatus Phycosocius bacilliformis TaxID=1445552 RepID=UPI001788DE8C
MTNTISQTAVALEAIALSGQMVLGDRDNRDSLDTESIDKMADVIASGLAQIVSGTRSGDLAPSILKAICDGLNRQRKLATDRLDRVEAQLTEMVREQMAHNGSFGSEIDDVAAEELVTQRDDLEQWEQTLTDALAAFADASARHTGERWMPATVSGNVTLKSATLWEARALIARRAEKARTNASAVQSVIFIADASLTKGQSPEALAAITNHVFKKLDALNKAYPGMALVVTGQKSGGDLLAQKWAEARGGQLIMQRTDWGNGSNRAAAIFKRNDDMLRLLPVAVVGYPQGNPALEKLAANARAKG